MANCYLIIQLGLLQCNFHQFHKFILFVLIMHYLSCLWIFIIINVNFNASFINSCRNGVFGCILQDLVWE